MCRVGPLDGLPGLITGDNIVDQWFDLGEDEWYTRQKDGTRGCGKGVGKVRLQLRYMPMKELRALKTNGTLTRSSSLIREGQVRPWYCNKMLAIDF